MKLENSLNSILSNELIFLIKYLEGKRYHRERFDQFILNMNDINDNIHEFMENALSILGSLYIRTIKKNDTYYHLELTEMGLEVTNLISYPNQIIRKNLFWKTILSVIKIINWLIIWPIKYIPKFFGFIFTNKLAKIILFIAALLGGAIACIQLYNFYKTGVI